MKCETSSEMPEPVTLEDAVSEVLNSHYRSWGVSPTNLSMVFELGNAARDLAECIDRSWDVIFAQHMCNNLADEEEKSLRALMLAAFVKGDET